MESSDKLLNYFRLGPVEMWQIVEDVALPLYTLIQSYVNNLQKNTKIQYISRLPDVLFQFSTELETNLYNRHPRS